MQLGWRVWLKAAPLLGGILLKSYEKEKPMISLFYMFSNFSLDRCATFLNRILQTFLSFYLLLLKKKKKAVHFNRNVVSLDGDILHTAEHVLSKDVL